MSDEIIRQITFVLPEINGAFSAGIAQGTEAALNEEEKLDVLAIEKVNPATPAVGDTPAKASTYSLYDRATTIKMTLAYLYDKLRATNKPEKVVSFLLQSANVALSFGLLRKLDQVKDGDWKLQMGSLLTEAMVTKERNEAIKASLDRYTVTTVVSVLAATKVNWWKENHHTGQGEGSGRYITKAFNALIGENFNAEWRTAVHRAGHWCSTRFLLETLGVKNIIRTEPVIRGTATVTATDDVKLRLASSPAGTGRMSILYAILRSFLNSPAIYMVPHPEDFTSVKDEYNKMMANNASYHVGGAYLTGTRAVYSDTDYSNRLGRAVTWLKAFMPKSTINESPHARNAEAYEDYDPEFAKMLDEYRRTSKDRAKKVLAAINSGGSVDVSGTNNLLRAWGMKINQGITDAVVAANAKAKEKSTPGPSQIIEA